LCLMGVLGGGRIGARLVVVGIGDGFGWYLHERWRSLIPFQDLLHVHMEASRICGLSIYGILGSIHGIIVNHTTEH